MSLDWMPIETAPSDTRVLVYGKYDGVVIGIYSEVLQEWYLADDFESERCHPTDWQPLPPPPSLKK